MAEATGIANEVEPAEGAPEVPVTTAVAAAEAPAVAEVVEIAAAEVEAVESVAVEAVVAEPVAVETAKVPAAVRLPKAKRPRKPVAAKTLAPVTEPVVVAPAAKAPLAKAKVAAKPRSAAKAPAAAKPERKPKAAAKPQNNKKTTISQLKESIMANKTTADFTEGFKDVLSDVQAKAKEGFEKSTAVFGEAGTFAKGNVEALVESGKILAAGIKEFGEGYAAEAKAAYETLSTDAKELTAVKSPVDFFKLQGELARRNFDQAVAFGSKSSEAFMKLAGEAFVPLQSRVSLAMEKVKKVA